MDSALLNTSEPPGESPDAESTQTIGAVLAGGASPARRSS
jgi:hypothetical protein